MRPTNPHDCESSRRHLPQPRPFSGMTAACGCTAARCSIGRHGRPDATADAPVANGPARIAHQHRRLARPVCAPIADFASSALAPDACWRRSSRGRYPARPRHRSAALSAGGSWAGPVPPAGARLRGGDSGDQSTSLGGQASAHIGCFAPRRRPAAAPAGASGAPPLLPCAASPPRSTA